MPNSYLPLCWESTGDQWWYATPIDWAAANGLCDLVKELLSIDPNLLIKLTSLRRIRRLETVWEDGVVAGPGPCNDVAKGRANVARTLLLDCEPKKSGDVNSLIRAGYGGWLLYTAASAGDMEFVKDLLKRDQFLVFGEGEYGITDILFAAARSWDSEVFRVVLEFAMNVNKGSGELGEGFVGEMMNRTVHAAARGGNWEVLQELLSGCSDVLTYRDRQGSTVLHSASSRGQVEVVKELIATYDIVNCADNQGNTALHVAAYRGYCSAVEVIALAVPSSARLRNNDGDTFLHMAVAGFRSPGFHRIDQQINLMKQLVSGKIICLKDIINVRNNEGRTALHIAVAENIQCNVVELLMSVPSVDLNVRDIDGLTPLDLLKQCPKTATSEILIKQIASAGGISNCYDRTARSALARHLKIQGIGTSPGTSFRLPDAELFSYDGNDNCSDISCEPASSRFSSCSSELTTSHFDSSSGIDVSKSNRKSRSLNSASRRLKFLLQWPRRAEGKFDKMKLDEDITAESFKVFRNVDDNITPLRQKFSKRGEYPSPSTREKFVASLMHGVIQATPPKSVISSAHYSPLSPFSESLASSPTSVDKPKGDHVEGNGVERSKFFSGPLSGGRSLVNEKHRTVSSFNKSLMNQYFCFGSQGLAVEDSVTCRRVNRSCRRLVF